MNSDRTRRLSRQTRAVRAALETDTQHGAVVPPLWLSSNFTFAGFADKRAYDYTRSGNPTRDALADALAELDGGTNAVVTASGMAALTLVTALLEPGSRLIAPHDCYGGTYRLLTALAARSAFAVDFVDQTDEVALERAFAASPRPAMVLCETPSNPLLRITDVRALAGRCRAVGAMLVVDNTFLSPLWQRPIELGADLVVYSTTKYLNGHSDVVGGALVAADEALGERCAWWANCLGLTGAPFDSYLTLRGLRTLSARLACHERNAQAVLEALQDHPAVAAVHHPSLATHPGHEVARRQQHGFGAMTSLELHGGRAAAAAFCEHLRCFSLAESLGGVESLVAHPATMTHASMTDDARARAGIGEGLVRLSIGIEDPADLVADVRAALLAVTALAIPLG